jgi:hypothetical protein
MGFWAALDKAFPSTRHQRYRVHKVKNVLNCFPKKMTTAVKSDLDDIQHPETRAAANFALDIFKEKYGVKYEKEVACLTKGKDAMLAFLDFPAEHWGHLRTSNRRCCRTLIVEDSHCESMRLCRRHEQAITCPLSHHELVRLHRLTEKAWLFADLAGQGYGMARAA